MDFFCTARRLYNITSYGDYVACTGRGSASLIYRRPGGVWTGLTVSPPNWPSGFLHLNSVCSSPLHVANRLEKGFTRAGIPNFRAGCWLGELRWHEGTLLDGSGTWERTPDGITTIPYGSDPKLLPPAARLEWCRELMLIQLWEEITEDCFEEVRKYAPTGFVTTNHMKLLAEVFNNFVGLVRKVDELGINWRDYVSDDLAKMVEKALATGRVTMNVSVPQNSPMAGMVLSSD